MRNESRIPWRPEFAPLRKLRTPRQVQDFVDALGMNRERRGETCSSPLVTLRRGTAHCMEGALVAALALWMHGHRPLIFDLRATPDDVDHRIALFKIDRHWGGISKTSHAVLRYREPVYRDVRELAISYFHEYFMDDGRKTLRQYSRPYDLRRWKGDWITATDDLWELEDAMEHMAHRPLLSRKQVAGLRRAGAIEIRAGKIVER